MEKWQAYICAFTGALAAFLASKQLRIAEAKWRTSPGGVLEARV